MTTGGRPRGLRAVPARLACSAAVLGVVGLLIAGCGTSSPSGSSGSSASGSFTAYRNCLSQHGVSLPSGGPGSGGFGGGGFGGGGSGGTSSTFQKAAAACASLRPSFGSGGSGGFGGFGGSGGSGGGGFYTAIQAFRTCMSDHGESIPTTRPTSPPSAGSSSADRFLNGLNPSNSKVAAALKACESKLPSFPSGSG